MKKLITILALFVTSSCLGQTKTVTLSPYESSKIVKNDELVKQFDKLQQEYQNFLVELLTVNGVNLSKVSTHPDSLKIEKDKITLILRK